MPIPTPTYPAQRSKKTPSKPPVIALGGGPRLIGSQAQPTTRGRPAAGGASHAVPTMPPPGTYDPTIDAQVRAGARGVQDLRADNALADSRGNQDYATSKEQVDTQSGWTLADLLTGRDRTFAADATARLSENQDYATAGSNLKRGYQNLGMAQTGAAAAHGLVGSGVQTGALAAALQARAANQGRDQASLDTTHDRNLSALKTADEQANTDYLTSYGRAQTQHDWTIGGLASDLQRGVDSRGIALGRADREQNLFGQDAATEAMYQATTSGLYVPPTPKKGKPKTSGKAKVDPKRPNVATGRGRA